MHEHVFVFYVYANIMYRNGKHFLRYGVRTNPGNTDAMNSSNTWSRFSSDSVLPRPKHVKARLKPHKSEPTQSHAKSHRFLAFLNVQISAVETLDVESNNFLATTGRTRQDYGGSGHAGMGQGQRAVAQGLRGLQGSVAEGMCFWLLALGLHMNPCLVKIVAGTLAAQLNARCAKYLYAKHDSAPMKGMLMSRFLSF